jgi:hypothetical protein
MHVQPGRQSVETKHGAIWFSWHARVVSQRQVLPASQMDGKDGHAASPTHEWWGGIGIASQGVTTPPANGLPEQSHRVPFEMH